MYTISQVAEITGVSAYTLRFYDKEGLFPYLSRDGKNNRLFSEQHLEWAMTLQCLRDTGMPLAEVREYLRLILLGDSTIPRRYQLILKRVHEAEQERLALEKRIDMLKRKLEYYSGLLEQHKEGQ